MASGRLISAGLVLILLGAIPFPGGAPLAAAASPETSVRADAAPPMNISIKEGLLFLDARDVEIRELLKAVADKTGIGLTVAEGVGGKISLTLEGVSLEEALRRLCQSRAILYEYDPQTRIGRIIGAGAYTAGTGKAAGLPAGGVAATAAGAGEAPKHDAVQAAGKDALNQAMPLPGAQGAEQRYDSRGRLLFKPRELLVRFRPEATATQIVALHQSLGSVVLKSLDNIKLHRVLLREGLSEREGIVLYRAAAIVAIAERHALRYPLIPPNDTQYGNQWGLPKIGMPAAWDITTGNANVVVGVIDTGVDTGHPDLAANLNLLRARDLAGSWRYTPATDADDNPMDKDGHGTHVAGIIAAVGNNGIGVAGVGWNLRILPLKVLADDLEVNSNHEMEIFDIVAAIDYAIAQGVRIVNCSYGGEAPDPDYPNPADPDYQKEVIDFHNEYDAMDRLRQAGILAVCAAGNGGIDNDTNPNRTYPASHGHLPYTDAQGTVHPALDNIVSVAASNSSDGLWWSSSSNSSNYGQNSVDLMAPGSTIRSACLCSPTGACGTGSAYCDKTGTSMATPHVSGVAGLILSRNPGLSYARVKSVILDSVDKIDAVTYKLVSGGRLNAATALGKVCLAGDLTGDGLVDLGDVILALQVTAGLEHGAGAQACPTADVNRDDKIGLAEVIYGLKVLSGISP